MIGRTVPEPVVRLDAITEPGGKRRNDPLDRPELLVSELQLLHVLAADRAPSQRFSESGRGQARERADAAQDGLRAFGKRLMTNLQVAGGRQVPRVDQEPLDRSDPVLRRHGFRLRPVGCERSRSPVLAPPEREVGPPVDSEETRDDRARITDHVHKHGARENRVEVEDASAVAVSVDERRPRWYLTAQRRVSHPLRVFASTSAPVNGALRCRASCGPRRSHRAWPSTGRGTNREEERRIAPMSLSFVRASSGGKAGQRSA